MTSDIDSPPARPACASVLPGEPGWDAARGAWNLAADQHPAARRARVGGGVQCSPAELFGPGAAARLAAVKAEVDPGDLLRTNHPVTA